MEVHHSHHPAHKKKWTEYLLEFLMLFLAVFLGFLAENQREHFVEAHRAKDYARSFLSDLGGDTLEVQTAFKSESFRIACIDSIIAISSATRGSAKVPGKFYYFSRFVSNLYTLDWNTSTIHQLIQSGNLRYFKNKEMVRKINAYYAEQQIRNRNNQISHESRMKAADLRGQILQSQYFSPFTSLNFVEESKAHVSSPLIDSLMQSQLSLTKEADKYMDQYINLLSDWKWRLEFYVGGYPKLIQEIKDIMQMLKEEYSLE